MQNSLNSRDNTSEADGSFVISDQYVKRLVFENSNYFANKQSRQISPDISVNLETSNHRISQDTFESLISIKVTAVSDGKSIFSIDVEYGAIANVKEESTENHVLEHILCVHCPFIMFPYVRSIITNVSISGGYGALYLDPVDFMALYMEKKNSVVE